MMCAALVMLMLESSSKSVSSLVRKTAWSVLAIRSG